MNSVTTTSGGVCWAVPLFRFREGMSISDFRNLPPNVSAAKFKMSLGPFLITAEPCLYRWKRRANEEIFVSNFTVGQHSSVLVPHRTGLLDEDHFGWIGVVRDSKGLHVRSPLTSWAKVTRWPSAMWMLLVHCDVASYSILSMSLCSAWATFPWPPCRITNSLPRTS